MVHAARRRSLCLRLLLLASLLFSSCIGIDSTLTLRDGGAGTLVLSYRVAQVLADLGLSATGSSAVPLPLTRADFDRSVEGAKGKVRIARFDRSENETDVSIRVEIAFDSLEALSALDTFSAAGMTLTADSGRQTFTQVIARAAPGPVSEDSLAMLDALFPGYELSFVFLAPRTVQAVGLGTLGPDKRTVTWKAPVKEVVTAAKDLVLTVTW